ncbi:TetR/AcrR family transcriptional regulator [Herbiconiux daphne]|uniref:TetR/AcrR family transcriptional regulator n=1 Tax=Herbiconiux daphne TaxID=2970914 RepID=A0ABT2H557_9MICO|nr:TetR/AcrR family transcriptional regulator [Herbiconiux daphne]MCS5735072.1 TetR/AcrR family transcriptional regulator [Herbiconiux daphne]
MVTEKTRSYNSPRRLRDSLDTRRSILDSALELLAAKGYAHVTIAEIATHAGVAVRTVYTSVGSKPEILAAVISRAAAYSGGPEVLEQVRRSTKTAEVLQLLASGTRAGNQSNRAIFDLARSTVGEPEADQLRGVATQLYLDLLHQAAMHLDAMGGLPSGMSAKEAGETLWFCFGFEAWGTVTRDLGLGWDEAESWLIRRAQLLLQA